MEDKMHDVRNSRLSVYAEKAAKTTREKLRELCDCNEVVADAEVLALGRIDREMAESDDNASSDDEVDEILEAEYRRLNDALDLPVDTYSLTRISPNLPTCVKYGVRSGLTNQNMQKFSPLSRGLQGPAVAIAAFATTALVKARCWNELTIDRIVDDGDTYYCQSYDSLNTDDRRTLNVLDLNKHLTIQNTHRVYVTVDEPAYAGTFRSATPTELHVAKALELFFKRYDAGILASKSLNIAVWKDSKYINIFDGQPRTENLLPTNDASGGSAKLILVRDLTGLAFIILEKSAVDNEHFVLYGLGIRGINKLPTNEDDPEEPEKSIGKPSRRPSGYIIKNKYRAVVRGSFHITHDLIPAEIRGHGHLVVALAALIYSRLVNANKWTTAMIDLIFNQAHIYLVDLVRVLEKKFDETFDMKIDDVMGDVVLGVYSAKVNVAVNVVPGQAKKGKATIDTGVRDFFATNNSSILEIKKKFYAVWKESSKYYFLDPFACDDEGFRVDADDPENVDKYAKARACVTMNSSINELIETILENTGNKEKDPFVMHGLRVLYVKTGTVANGSRETVIYREKKTNRRPLGPEAPKPEPIDECKIVKDTIPRPRENAERTKEAYNQYPELMKRIEDYAMKDDEPTTFVESQSDGPDSQSKKARSNRGNENKDDTSGSEKNDVAVEDRSQEDTNVQTVDEEIRLDEVAVDKDDSPIDEEEVKFIKGYGIINPHRIILHGSVNCLDDNFEEASRGRQGLIIALTAIAYSKIKDPTTWRNLDVDQIVRVGNGAYSDVVQWIREGSPSRDARETDEEAGVEDEENEEEEEEGDEEVREVEEEDEAEGAEKSRTFKGVLKPAPSHIDVSMIPTKMKLGDNEITYKKKERVAEGDADPLANLGEALDRCFEKYNQIVLENNRLMYGMWKHDDKYFMVDPYGSDEEGWRLRDYPASVVVTDTINELTDALHGVLEFNERTFSIHFIGIESIQPGNKYIDSTIVNVPEDETMEIYRTRFLPVTDQDLFVPQLESDGEDRATEVEQQEAVKDENVEDDEEDEDEEGEDEEAEAENDEDKDGKETEDMLKEAAAPDKPLDDPILEIGEQERPDGPERLNLSLLTGSVKIEKDETTNEESAETLAYERLKYSHPPPYVLPPKKVLCVLLDAKKASGSMHSLISRFSIDSKLAVKAITDLPSRKTTDRPAITTVTPTSAPDDHEKPVKMIKLPPTKYLFSRIPPEGYTPLRAIDEKFIHDEAVDRANEDECRLKRDKRKFDEFVRREIPEDPIGLRVNPEIIPLGPTIRTPVPKKKSKPCPDNPKIRKCRLTAGDGDDKTLENILCNTEDVLFDVIFPSARRNNAIGVDDHSAIGNNDVEQIGESDGSAVRVSVANNEETNDGDVSEMVGFRETENNVGIIEGNTCLRNRGKTEDCHLKCCFVAAVLCILAKVQTDANSFRGTILDRLILASEKIHQRTGPLRHKSVRWFRNVVILDSKCNVILKQSVYADPDNCEADELSSVLRSYVTENQTGILVFSNASYAFWLSNGEYHIFDPYGCDDRGVATEIGNACLLKFCDLEGMIARIMENNGETAKGPYRIYALSIAHMEPLTTKKRSRKKRKRCEERESENSLVEEITEDGEDSDGIDESRRELSLMELAEWVNNDVTPFDANLRGFAAIENFNASALEVFVVENDVTRPVLAPFKKIGATGTPGAKASLAGTEPVRKRPYDRKFADHTCLSAAVDLCVMAWSRVRDPALWGVRTVRGIYEAGRDLAFDSLLAAKDSTVTDMTDGVLSEFSIANYSFRAVFAPLHRGKLYAAEGWNLAMSLKKLFDISIYSGAIVVCGDAHVAVMKKGINHYAWWPVSRTKKLRIVTSECLEDFLKLIVKVINEREEKMFAMRVVTISYAKKLDPDCSDVGGLHEPVVPATSLPQIHRKESPRYDLDAIFRPTMPNEKPIFIVGTVALRNRDVVIEPRIKRCYFAALLSVMVKRDVVQSPVPEMIDKIIQVAENVYKEFDDPKYHAEHILRNVTIMNRMFDFRDCATPLFAFKENPNTGKIGFFPLVRKQLRLHLKKHTGGIIQFTNCCYGFWHSRSTNAYYYLDPYPCNSRGRRRDNGGTGCLGIFSSICQMARQMCSNRFEDTTGFFIHRLHVESINVPPFEIFREDPMWVYLDYHWSFVDSPITSGPRGKSKKKRNRKIEESEKNDICEDAKKSERSTKPSWNNYTVEVPNLIYSAWGTLGCWDTRFGDRAGNNRAAICIATIAMRNLCHPSRWGPAILDSAIICGDSYYTESLRNAVKRGSNYSSNRFNLQSCFKVFPHIWTIEFHPNMCGILYGSRERPCLATILKSVLENSSNIVIECGKVTVAVLSCDDGYYVVDPCWTGPPLFSKNHGAVYALRCRNANALIYAVTKIFNTNQRLEFRATPVDLTFSQELCKFADSRDRSSRKEILADALGTRPGTADGPDTPVPGALTVTEEDAYPSYRRNIGIGMLRGSELENPTIASSFPRSFVDGREHLIAASTAWHLNVGRPSRNARSNSILQARSTTDREHMDSCRESGIPTIEPNKTLSITDKLPLCDDYPRTVDFVATTNDHERTAKILTRRRVASEVAPSIPMDCSPPRKFLRDASRREFKRRNKEMADEVYRIYKHRAGLDVVDGNGDAEESPVSEPVVVESATVENADE